MLDFQESQERKEKVERMELMANQEFPEKMVLPVLKVHGDHEVLPVPKDPLVHKD